MNGDLLSSVLRPGLTRRRFVLALPLLGALPYLALSPRRVLAMSSTPGLERASRVLMGTRVDIVVPVGDGLEVAAARSAIERAFSEMRRLEALMSRYRDDSDVARIGAAAGRHPVHVAPSVMAVLQQAQRLHRDSGGMFDVTVGALRGWHFETEQHEMPSANEISRELALVNAGDLRLDTSAGTAYLARTGMQLDLGGIAKLPILKAGLQVLEHEGVAHALVNGGGDVLTMGRQHGRPWRVGIRDPLNPSQLFGAAELEGRAVVASSGDYERGFMLAGRRLHHVLDPRTGWPTRGVHGVALLARSIEEVNGWGTALMVGGPKAAPEWQAKHPAVELMLAGADGNRWLSPGMSSALRPGIA
jgi:thiamine biosynthesis lipoprotein